MSDQNRIGDVCWYGTSWLVRLGFLRAWSINAPAATIEDLLTGQCYFVEVRLIQFPRCGNCGNCRSSKVLVSGGKIVCTDCYHVIEPLKEQADASRV